MPRVPSLRKRAPRRRVLRGILIVGAVALVAGAAVGREYVRGHPYYWSPVAAELRVNGRPVEGGVFRRGNLYLLEYGGGSGGTCLSIDPVAGDVTMDNAPTRWFLGRRSVTLRGVGFGGGKLENEATVARRGDAIEVHIVPGLAAPLAPPDAIEIRLPPR